MGVSKAAVGRPGDGIPALPGHRHDGDTAQLRQAIAFPGNTASTFLTHFFGGGADELYVVEMFKALTDGDIRRLAGQTPTNMKRSKRKVKRATATQNEAKETGLICPLAWQR